MLCRIEILNGNSSYRKMLIKETEIFCGFVGGHRSNIFRCNDFRKSNLILQALIYKIALKTDFKHDEHRYKNAECKIVCIWSYRKTIMSWMPTTV